MVTTITTHLSKIDFSQINYIDGFCNVLTLCNQAYDEANNNLSKPIAIGVDEVGRGCLLGPAAVGSVILDDKQPIEGLTDSKKLTAKKREAYFEMICEQAKAVQITFVSAPKIDEINILQATLSAMSHSVTHLMSAHTNTPTIQHKEYADNFHVLVDGNQTINTQLPCSAIVKGDALHAEISAASIIAKVCRDAYMDFLHLQYPQYAINQHKGYPTKLHKQILEEHDILAEHRRSFNPIKSLFAKQ